MQMYEKIVISTKKILSFWYFSLKIFFFHFYIKEGSPGAAFLTRLFGMIVILRRLTRSPNCLPWSMHRHHQQLFHHQ